MAKRTYTVRGRLIDRNTGQKISRLRIEAWDKDLIFDDFLDA